MGSRARSGEDMKLSDLRRRQQSVAHGTSGGDNMGLRVPTKAMLKQGLSNYPATTPHQGPSTSKGVRGVAAGSSSANKNQYSPGGIHSQQTCCIIHKNQRCHQYVGAGGYEYTKKMQKVVNSIKKLQLKADYRARHVAICDYHKTIIDKIVNQSYSNIDRKKQSNSDPDDTESNDEEEEIERKWEAEIDFSRFSQASLQKYKNYFGIPGQLSKEDLTQAVTRHFKTMPVLIDEKNIIMDFMIKIKVPYNEHPESVSDG